MYVLSSPSLALSTYSTASEIFYPFFFMLFSPLCFETTPTATLYSTRHNAWQQTHTFLTDLRVFHSGDRVETSRREAIPAALTALAQTNRGPLGENRENGDIACRANIENTVSGILVAFTASPPHPSTRTRQLNGCTR